MERYSEYKPTSMQWLKEIPSHWEEKRLKYIVTIKSGDAIRNQQLSDEGKYPVYGGGQCIGYSDRYNTTAEDLLIGRVGAKCGCVTFPGIKSWATDNALIISTNFNRRLLSYILIACDLNRLNTSNAQPLITSTKVKNTGIPIPPLAEQERIVSYLEDKTSKIDAYVAEKEKEILLLQELKQKTIADVVTKGLNPDVKMKDSGISWIGMIPEHWEMKQLRSFLTLFTEKNHGDAQLLSITREQGVVERDKDDKEGNHNYVPDDLSGYKYIEKGDFAINKMKAWQGSYAVSEYNGIVSPAYYTCKLKGVNNDFFSKAIRSKAYVPFFTQYSKGIRVGQWDLDPNALKSIPFILSPVDEQCAIVAYIDEKCKKIDTLVSELQAEIDNMKEYKQRLIADCVTGQVNVQNETV